MARNHTQLVVFTVLITVFTLGGCSQLLEVTPRQSATVTNTLSTSEGLRSAVVTIYSYLKSQELYGRDLLAIAEALADDARIMNRADGRFVNEGNNVANFHLGGWATYYAAINEINLILDALPSSPLSQAERNAIEGEIKFLRALNYFNLVRIYAYDPQANVVSADRGGVPLMLRGVSSGSQVQYPARASVADIYKQIYADLTDAIAKAPVQGAPSRATRASAQALLARVCLYNRDYVGAIKYSTDALSAGIGRFVANNEYLAAWRSKSHPEAIFEVAFQNPKESLGQNNSLQSAYTTFESVQQAVSIAIFRPTTPPPASGWGAVVPSNAFLAIFPTGDVRRQLFLTGLSRANALATECLKFLGKTGTIYMDNIPVIRVSELYLIRAEAYARSNDNALALADLNRIRTRAGLGALAGTTTQTQILTDLQTQRRIELSFEGHRWFDLKRLKQDVVKPSGNVPFTDFRVLAPIPEREIALNKNLIQNKGY